MILYICYLAWFGSHFLYNNFTTRTERSEIVLWGLLEAAVVFLMALSTVVRNLVRAKAFPIRNPSDRRILWVLVAWIVLSLIAAWIGWSKRNDLSYFWGDMYRFLSLPIVLGSFYFGNFTIAAFWRMLRGFVLVYVVFLISDAILYLPLAFQGIRPATESAMAAGVVAPLLIYGALFDPSRVFRVVARMTVLAMFASLIVAQMFTPILALLCVFALFLLPTRRPSLVAGLALGVGVLIVAVYYTSAILGTNLDYLREKIQLARSSDSPAEIVESLSGVRLGEILFVLQTMRDSPGTIPFGAGLGSMVGAVTPGWSLPARLQYKHYLHSGLNDILYRGGALAFSSFLLLLGLLFWRGYSLHAQGHSVGSLLMVSAANLAVLMSFACDLDTALLALAVGVAAVSIPESNLRQWTHPARTRPASSPNFLGVSGRCKEASVP